MAAEDCSSNREGELSCKSEGFFAVFFLHVVLLGLPPAGATQKKGGSSHLNYSDQDTGVSSILSWVDSSSSQVDSQA